jgi:8-oxo-dGTP pyrophosphatase MutT (NUDIX family)
MGRIRVRAIIECDSKYLFVRNKTSKDFWCLPGGGVEEGEDIVSALKRELVEETGIKPIVGDLLYVHQIGSKIGFGAPEFFFYVENGNDYLNIDLLNTSHGELEIAEISFRNPKDTELLPSFLKQELPELKKLNFKLQTRIRLSNL